MKLLFIGYFHGFGGAEKMLVMLANEMAKRGNDVYLISLTQNNIEYEINKSINCVFIPDEGSNKIQRIINRYLKLKKYIILIKPSLIVNFWFQSTYLCACMSKDIRQKTIYSERGDPSDKEYMGIKGIIRNITFKRIKGFVFQSKGALNTFNDDIIRRSVIIHNPVYINKNNRKSIEKKIINVGRLHPQKNQKLLIKAFSLLPDDKKDFILEIYGEGELKHELENLIDELNLTDRIILKGTVRNVLDQVKSASLFVLSSDYEGLPNALLEALALGVPCISTDCKPGGAKEIITPNIDGIIVPRGNAEKLSEAINYLLSNPDIMKLLSENSIKSSKRFEPKKIFDKWNNYFIQLSSEIK